MKWVRSHLILSYLLRKKCRNTEFFSGPNTGKCGSEKSPYLDTFHTVADFVTFVSN